MGVDFGGKIGHRGIKIRISFYPVVFSGGAVFGNQAGFFVPDIFFVKGISLPGRPGGAPVGSDCGRGDQERRGNVVNFKRQFGEQIFLTGLSLQAGKSVVFFSQFFKAFILSGGKLLLFGKALIQFFDFQAFGSQFLIKAQGQRG